jgi:hypothetical protein
MSRESYVYKDEIICGMCARDVFAKLDPKGCADDTGDSDTYPQEMPTPLGASDWLMHCEWYCYFFGNALTERGRQIAIQSMCRRLKEAQAATARHRRITNQGWLSDGPDS